LLVAMAGAARSMFAAPDCAAFAGRPTRPADVAGHARYGML